MVSRSKGWGEGEVRREGLFSPALCPGLKESDKGPTLNRTVTLHVNCDMDGGLQGTSLPQDPVCPSSFSVACWPAGVLWPASRRWRIPRGGLERRSGAKSSFSTMLPCLYIEMYHTCTKNPNERNGKQTAKGKRAFMGKMGCGLRDSIPVLHPPAAAGLQAKHQLQPTPPIKVNSAPTPPPGEMSRARKLAHPSPLFLTDIYASLRCLMFLLQQKCGGKKVLYRQQQQQ